MAWDLVSSVRRYDQSLFIEAECSVSGMFDGSENLDEQMTVMAYEILRMAVTVNTNSLLWRQRDDS